MKYRGSLLSYPKFMILVEEEKRNGKYSHEKARIRNGWAKINGFRFYDGRATGITSHVGVLVTRKDIVMGG